MAKYADVLLGEDRLDSGALARATADQVQTGYNDGVAEPHFCHQLVPTRRSSGAIGFLGGEDMLLADPELLMTMELDPLLSGGVVGLEDLGIAVGSLGQPRKMALILRLAIQWTEQTIFEVHPFGLDRDPTDCFHRVLALASPSQSQTIPKTLANKFAFVVLRIL